MTTKNPVGFCPSCKEQVLLKREEMDICLLIILFIFTAGIGALIYALIHLSKPENRCIHCNSVVESPLPNQKQYSKQELVYRMNGNPYNSTAQVKAISVEGNVNNESEKTNYCPNCGVKLANRDNILFCPYCGSSTQ